MARKSAVDSEAASPGNASAHSDVEMQDQQDDKGTAFNKLGVSVALHAPAPANGPDQQADVTDTV